VHCILIYNPASGRGRNLRLQRINEVAGALTAEGHRADALCTTGPGSAAGQARAAAASADVIFACGGDGTVHEVLQGLVTEAGVPRCALGIVPLGSANVLARHLRISLDPVVAALEQLRGGSCPVPVGRVECAGAVRYFAFMTGAGPDGALVYNLLAQEKAKLGRLAYYTRAARLFATRRFSAFEVQFTPAASNSPVTRMAVSVMATRIGNLGGVFRGLTDGQASMQDSELCLHLLDAPARVSLPLWFLSGWLGLRRLNPFHQCIRVSAFSCSALSSPAPYVEADGESLGRLPMQVSLLPNALRILVPRR
jgi:diacylglycerol kinase (ATP)